MKKALSFTRIGETERERESGKLSQAEEQHSNLKMSRKRLHTQKNGTGHEVADLLRAKYCGLPRGYELRTIAKQIIAVAGKLKPSQLRPAHVIEIDDQIKNSGYKLATKVCKANCLRQILCWLWEVHGAEKLDRYTSRYTGIRPRNVTCTEVEIDRMMQIARPYMRLFLLLCSDLAIRSGTATVLGPQNYDQEKGELRFTTKFNEKLMLPVTAEIKEILDKLDMKSDVPFVRQLQLQEPWIVGRSFRRNLKNKPSVDVQFRKLLKEAGITRPLRPHDLRRTTAVAMYKASKDVRDVQALLGHRSMQSTIWYLDHDLKPIDRKMLETIKRPFIAWRREQSA